MESAASVASAAVSDFHNRIYSKQRAWTLSLQEVIPMTNQSITTSRCKGLCTCTAQALHLLVSFHFVTVIMINVDEHFIVTLL